MFTQDQARTVATIAELARAGLTLRMAAHIADTGPEFERGAVQIRFDQNTIDDNLRKALP
jgi:hypothetical protein